MFVICSMIDCQPEIENLLRHVLDKTFSIQKNIDSR